MNILDDPRVVRLAVKTLGPGKTRTHCGGNIVSCDVARSWQNEETLLRAARTQEMFLKIFRNISKNFVS